MVIVTGFPQDYENWTKPLLEDLARYEPLERVVYEESIRGEGSWAIDLNKAAESFEDEWLTVLNNDSRCIGPFKELYSRLPRYVLMGKQLKTGGGLRWLEGACLVMHKNIWEKVGLFDENLKRAGLTDVDYSLRAELAGFELGEVSSLPFEHLYYSPQYHVKGVWDTFRENQKYFRRKYRLAPEWRLYAD